jgi:hypothetical protein
MRPWLVSAIHDRFIDPLTCVGGVQVEPPSSEETKPAVSSHVLTLQPLTG